MLDSKSVLNLSEPMGGQVSAPKSIAAEAGLPENWQPINTTPIIPSKMQQSGEPNLSALLQASLPPGFQHDVSFTGTTIRSSHAPGLSLMPLGLQGNPITNAAIQSTASITPTSVPSTVGGAVVLTMPDEFAVATTTTGTGENIGVTWVNEKPGTVFSGPPANLIGFDASFSTAGAVVSGPATATVVGDSPSGSPEWALYCGQTSGITFLADPAGWTPLGGDGAATPQLILPSIPAGGVTVTQSSASGTGSWATNLIYFGGAPSTFVQNATQSSGGTNTCSVTLPGATTTGNTLLIIIGASVGLPGGPPPQGGPGSYTFTDTQGLTAVLGVTSAESYSAIWGSGAQSAVMIAGGLQNTTETVTITSNVENSFNVTVYEITPLSPISARPRFRIPLPPDLSVITGVLGVASGGTGSNLGGTGGTSQVLKQTAVGANITVGQLGASDLSDGTTGGTPAFGVGVVMSAGILGTVGKAIFATAITGTGSNVFATSPTMSGATLSGTTAMGTINMTGRINTYNGFTATGQGVAPFVGTAGSTVAANVGATTIYAVPVASGGGFYRVSYWVQVTTPATVSSTLPDLSIKFTDPVSSTAQTLTFQATTVTGNTTTTLFEGVAVIAAKNNTNIQYQLGGVTTYASVGATSMSYQYGIRVEYIN